MPKACRRSLIGYACTYAPTVGEAVDGSLCAQRVSRAVLGNALSVWRQDGSRPWPALLHHGFDLLSNDDRKRSVAFGEPIGEVCGAELDHHGLLVEVQLDASPAADVALMGVRSGQVRHFSVGMAVNWCTKVGAVGRWPLYTLDDVTVREVSLTPTPADERAKILMVGDRTLDDHRMLSRS